MSAPRGFKFYVQVGLWSINFVMTDFPLSGRVLDHMSNFYILDLENFATASRRCIGAVSKTRRRSACGLHLRRSCWMHKFITRWSTATLYLVYFHYFTLFWICRASCCYTVMQQLARFWLTHRVAQSVYDSRASCWELLRTAEPLLLTVPCFAIYVVV